MPGKQYNVNILLRVLTEGVESAISLFSGKLQPAIDKVTNSTKGIESANNRVIDTYEKLTERISELNKIPKTQKSDEAIKELALLKKAQTEFATALSSGANEAKILKNLQNELASEGISGYKQLQKTVQNVGTSLSALEDIKIGGAESVKRLEEIIVKLRKGSDIKLEVDSATAIEEAKAVEKNLRGILEAAKNEGDIKVFSDAANTLKTISDIRRGLEKLLAERQKLDEKPVEIRIRIKEETPKIREELNNFKKEFELAKNIGLGVEFRSQGASDRLNDLIKRINAVKKDAESIGQETIDFDIRLNEIQQLKEDLKTVGQRKDRLAREEIRVKVANVSDLKKLDTEARNLLKSLEAAKSAGNIRLVAELETKRSDIQKRLNDLKEPIDRLAQSSKKTGLVEAFEGVNSKLIAAEKSVKSFDDESVKAAVNAQKENKKVSDTLSDLSVGARKLKKDLDEAFQQGAVGVRPTLNKNAQDLLSLIKKIQESSQPLSNKQLELFRGLQGQIGNALVRLNNLNSDGVKAGNDVQESIARLNREFSKASSGLSSLSTEFRKAQAIGASSSIAPKLDLRVDEFLSTLRNALAEAQRLGQKSTAGRIRLEIQNAEEFKNTLKSANLQKDLLAKSEIDVKVANIQDLKQLDADIRKLVKDIAEANRTGNIRAKFELELREEEILQRIEKLRKPVEALGQSKVEFFAGAERRFSVVEGELKKLNLVNVQNTEEASLSAKRNTKNLKDLANEAKKTAKQIELALQSGNYTVIPELEFKQESLRASIKQIENSFNDLSKSDIDLFRNIKIDVERLSQSFDRLKNEELEFIQQSKVAGIEVTRNLESIRKQANLLVKDVERANSQGAFVLKGDFEIRSSDINQLVQQVVSSGQRLTKEQFDLFTKVIADAKIATSAVKNFTQESTNAGNLSRDALASLELELRKNKSALSSINKEFKRTEEIGTSSLVSPKLVQRTQEIISNLEQMLVTAQKLGQASKAASIRFELTNARDLLNILSTTNEEKDKISRQKVELKVDRKAELSQLNSELSRLIKNLEKARNTGNITAKGEFERDIQSLQGRVTSFESSGADKLTKAEVEALQTAKNRLNTAIKYNSELTRSLELSGRQRDAASRNLTSEISNIGINVRGKVKEIEDAIRKGNFTINTKAELNVDDLFSKLQKIQDTNVLSDQQLKLLGKTRKEVSDLASAYDNYNTANLKAAEDSKVAERVVTNNFNRIAGEAKKLVTEIDKSVNTGNFFELKPVFDQRLNEFNSFVNQIANSGQRLSNTQIGAFQALKAQIVELENRLTNVDVAAVRAGRASSDAATNLASTFKNISSGFKNISDEFNKAAQFGKANEIKPKVIIDTEEILNQLEKALTEARRTGEKTKPIELKILEVNRFLDEVRKVDASVDALAKKKLLINPVIGTGFDFIQRRINQFTKELEEAQKRGDIRVVVKLQSDLDSIKRELEKLKPLVDQQLDKSVFNRFNKQRLAVDFGQDELNNLKNSVPSGVTGVLDSMRRAFKLAAQDAGGARGAITGLASTLRLVGTSAFLVGGELRTLGFGFSALANIVQNIGPVFFQFGASLAKAGPPGLALLGILTSVGVTAGVVAGQLVLVAGALGALVETGFKFNIVLEQTRNASAALASQFFDFFINGEKVNETVQVGGQLLSKYQVAQIAVEQQFKSLEATALSTIFTNKELLSTFQSIIIASNGLAPSLDAVTSLTGQFARVAGLIGISAEKLASQVNLVLSGAGRVTSPLQRFLNSAKDSQGIELTAKRIKQLRAEGGNVLFAELTTAISKFDEALKNANRTSITGILSNFQDLFELVSKRAVKSAFDTLRDNLGKQFDRLLQEVNARDSQGNLIKNKAGENVKVTEASEPLKQITNVASNLFDVLAKDIIRLVDFLITKLASIANYLTENYSTFLQIYELTKAITIGLGGIVKVFVSIFTLSSTTNDQLSNTVTILKFINRLVYGIRVSFEVVSIAVNGVLGLVGLLLIALSYIDIASIKASISIRKFFGAATEELQKELAVAEETLKTLKEFSLNRARSISNSGDAIIDGAAVVDQLEKDLDKLNTEKVKPVKIPVIPDIVSKGVGKPQDQEDKRRRERQKSELADTKSLSDAIKALGTQREQNQLKLVQDRLAQEKSLYQDLLDQNLISQQENAKKVLNLTNREIDNEIQARQNAIALIQQERLATENAFQEEVKRIREDAARNRESAEVKNSKLSVTNIKQATERIKSVTEELRVQGEIEALNLSKNVATREYLKIQQGINTELRRQVETQKASLDSLVDADSVSTLEFRTENIVRERIDELRGIENQIAFLISDISAESDQNVAEILNRQLGLLYQKRDLLKQEVGTRQTLLRLQTSENLLESVRVGLSLRDSERQNKVSNGLLNERQALIDATAERIKYKEVLQQVIDAQEELLNQPVDPLSNEQNLANNKRREAIGRLRQELAELKTNIDDKEIISAVDNIRNSFVDLFDKLQEGAGGAAASFADFGKSVLGIFRRLISERIVRELFGDLFNTQGQTQGQATGVFGKVLKRIGLGNDQDQAAAEARAKEISPVILPKDQELLNAITEAAKNSGKVLNDTINKVSSEIDSEVTPFKIAINKLTTLIEEAGTRLGIYNPSSVRADANRIVNSSDRVGISKSADDTINNFGSQTPQGKVQNLINLDKKDAEDIKRATSDSSQKITQAIINDNNVTKPVSIVDSGSILPSLSQYFSSLNSNIQSVIGAKLDQIIQILPTLAGRGSGNPVDVSALSGFGIPNEAEGFKRGGLIGFISGGAVDGQGGIRDDAVPARLSNGEYVMQAPIVKLLGKKYFDKLNSGILPETEGFASGGLLQNFARQDYLRPAIDTGTIDYSGGGASLINKPAPIVEPPKPKPKRVGGLRRFFGGLLSFVAPFLNFIPGIGPFLALGAGAAGGALSGNNLKESLVGGILGGLGNLGGLAGRGGVLGGLGNFFGSDRGKLLTGVLGGSSGNSGLQAGSSGQAILALLQRLGLFRKKRATGGIVQNLALGGLAGIFGSLRGIFSNIGGKLGGIFGKSGNGGSGTNGGSGGLLGLFGLSSLLGGLTSGGQQEPEFQEVIVDDPDIERKNRFGSAYKPLIDQGIIPGYKYSDETLNALIRQEEGLRNIVRLPKKSFFSRLLGAVSGFLPFLGAFAGNFGKSGGKFVDSALPGSGAANKFGDVFARNGGLIKMFNSGGHVLGAGTSTSDSILSLLSNGEYVIRASSVKMLGTDILDEINAGRFRFAEGGLVGAGVSSLPEKNPAGTAPNVNVGSPNIINVFDPNLVGDYVRTSDGTRAIINVISKNKKTVREGLK